MGESGCGKSTAVLQLIMRIYDPDRWESFVDGHDIKTLDLDWAEGPHRVTSAGEPVLFAGSIRDNMKPPTPPRPPIDIRGVPKNAEIFDFVQKELKEVGHVFVGSAGR